MDYLERSPLKISAIVLSILLVATPVAAQASFQFIRGDCNADERVDIADGCAMFQALLGTAPFCAEACDANDDDELTFIDPFDIFNYRLLGGPPPPPPFPNCGPPPGGSTLGCATPPVCGGGPGSPPAPGNVEISAPEIEIIGQQSITADITMSSDVPVQGFVLAICMDLDHLELIDVTVDGTITAMIGAEVVAPDIDPREGCTLGVALDFNPPFAGQMIPPGSDQTIARLSLNVPIPISLPEVTAIDFCDDVLGNPPLDNIVLVDCLSLSPTLVDGSITCLPSSSIFEFIRGDVDANGIFNGLADTLFLLDFQFLGGPTPNCPEAADADGNGVINGIVDGILLLDHQFNGGPPPVAPYPDCGPDPDPPTSLGCFVSC